MSFNGLDRRTAEEFGAPHAIEVKAVDRRCALDGPQTRSLARTHPGEIAYI